MAEKKKKSRWKIILRAWPPAGAAFVILSFLVTAFWTVYSILHDPEELNWLEPLAAFLAGLGAFIVAAILIFRKVDSAREEAEAYRLSRGLATGYYFNFIKPLVNALKDKKHPLHKEVLENTGHQIIGIVTGIPETLEEFDPENHDALIANLDKEKGGPFSIVEKKIVVPKRPRPVFFNLALSTKNKTAIIVDIPTTLSVVKDFAQFVAMKDLDEAPGADDQINNARQETVADKQAEEFSDVLSDFITTVSEVGSKDSNEQTPATLLHIVPMRNLNRRLDELADH